jgi:hypothetical protein
VAEKLKEMGFRVELSLDPTLDEFDKAQDAFESRLGPGVLAVRLLLRSRVRIRRG